MALPTQQNSAVYLALALVGIGMGTSVLSLTGAMTPAVPFMYEHQSRWTTLIERKIELSTAADLTIGGSVVALAATWIFVIEPVAPSVRAWVGGLVFLLPATLAISLGAFFRRMGRFEGCWPYFS